MCRPRPRATRARPSGRPDGTAGHGAARSPASNNRCRAADNNRSHGLDGLADRLSSATCETNGSDDELMDIHDELVEILADLRRQIELAISSAVQELTARIGRFASQQQTQVGEHGEELRSDSAHDHLPSGGAPVVRIGCLSRDPSAAIATPPRASVPERLRASLSRHCRHGLGTAEDDRIDDVTQGEVLPAGQLPDLPASVDIGAVVINIGLNAPSGGRERELAENHRETLRNVGGTSHGESPSRHRSESDGCPVRDTPKPEPDEFGPPGRARGSDFRGGESRRHRSSGPWVTRRCFAGAPDA